MSQEEDLLRSRVHKLEGLLEAQELDVERAHALMDQWGLPREVPLLLFGRVRLRRARADLLLL